MRLNPNQPSLAGIDWRKVHPSKRPPVSEPSGVAWYEETDLHKRRDYAWTQALEWWKKSRELLARGKVKTALNHAREAITTIHTLKAWLGLVRPVLPGASGGADEKSAEDILAKLNRIKHSRFRPPDREQVLEALDFAAGRAEELRDDARRRHRLEDVNALLERVAFSTDAPTQAEWEALRPWLDFVEVWLEGLTKTQATDEGGAPGVFPRARMRWLLQREFSPWVDPASPSLAPDAPPPRVARGVFAASLTAALPPRARARSFVELRAAVAAGMRGSRKTRDRVAEDLGTSWGELIEELEAAAVSADLYRIPLIDSVAYLSRGQARTMLAETPRDQLGEAYYWLEATQVLDPQSFASHAHEMAPTWRKEARLHDAERYR